MTRNNQIALDEIRAAKAEAEKEVMKVLERFKERTGLMPTGCDVSAWHGVTTNGHKQYVLSGVTLVLEPI